MLIFKKKQGINKLPFSEIYSSPISKKLEYQIPRRWAYAFYCDQIVINSLKENGINAIQFIPPYHTKVWNWGLNNFTQELLNPFESIDGAQELQKLLNT